MPWTGVDNLVTEGARLAVPLRSSCSRAISRIARATQAHPGMPTTKRPVSPRPEARGSASPAVRPRSPHRPNVIHLPRKEPRRRRSRRPISAEPWGSAKAVGGRGTCAKSSTSSLPPRHERAWGLHPRQGATRHGPVPAEVAVARKSGHCRAIGPSPLRRFCSPWLQARTLTCERSTTCFQPLDLGCIGTRPVSAPAATGTPPGSRAVDGCPRGGFASASRACLYLVGGELKRSSRSSSSIDSQARYADTDRLVGDPASLDLIHGARNTRLLR